MPPVPADASPRRAFGSRLGEARAAMAALAARQDPHRLEALFLPLFAAFAPIPDGTGRRAWLDLGRIARADCGG